MGLYTGVYTINFLVACLCVLRLVLRNKVLGGNTVPGCKYQLFVLPGSCSTKNFVDIAGTTRDAQQDVTMAHDVLLIFCLLTCISVIKGQMSSVKYEVVDNKTTWIQAVNACSLLNGTLIDYSEYHRDVNNITISANNSYWTGNFKFMTNWVQLKGCFSQVGTNNEDKCLQFDQSIRPLGWSCYMFCYDYQFFGIRDDVCKCISKEPKKRILHNGCPACNDSSRYQCGKGVFTAVYQIRRNFTIKTGDNTTLCAAYNCQQSSNVTVFDFEYQGYTCDKYNPAFCSDQTNTTTKPWEDARRMCEEKQAYVLQFSVNNCTSALNKPMWDNIHREILLLTRQFEVSNGLNIHHNHQPRQCSYIEYNVTEPGNASCSSQEHGFICKIGNFTDDNTTTYTLCNITETEADQSSTDATDGDTTTTMSNTGQKMVVVNSTDERMYIAIGAGAGGFLVVILVVIIIICTCRKRSHKSNTDETAGDYKKEIDVDDGEMNHITAAERYISIKSEQVSVKYTVENGKAATKTSEPGKSWGGGYEQVVLPNEEPDSGFLDQDRIVDHVKQTQPSPDIHETPNAIQYTEEEDDYAEVDSESVTEENIPEICIKSASIKKAETNDEQEAEDDYDHFGQPDQRQSVSSNYDHVHLRNSRKSKKGNNQDDSEDYDHIPGAGGRQEETEVDSTYDHTQIFGLRESTASVSSNYDHVVLLKNQCGQEDALNRISDDYDHTNNVSKVKVADGDRDSNYTQVILPDSP